ncbi:TonB-dependent receptor [Bacteroidales bacterium OttesenSCG-928-L03]|nr:TonB-dependent receptor [Bacteroidales bacterium OttesenSCG-928-L03]
MKNKKRFILTFFSLLMFCAISLAQGTVRGQVLDEAGESVIGANVSVRGTTQGAITDIDGNFQINDVAPNSTIEISYIGYMSQSIPFTGQSFLPVVLKKDAQLLDEVVVIGYGSMKKEDLTGSITAIGEKDFNKGLATSPTELISGKVAGVQITSNGGRAGSGSRIRIRGGASLNASNDPLFVIDGVPVANSGISGSSDVLSTINPNDIESMNILKDASATAIYGSRASNGVVIITTKKGKRGQKLQIGLSTQNTLSTIANTIDLMNADEFREAVMNNKFATDQNISYLGKANTDWQKEIYRNAFTTDNNINISGSIGQTLPFRVSAGFLSQDGILKTDNMKRGTASLNLSPVLLDDHLSVNVNLKGTYTDSHFGNGDAIGAAIRMDPTQPVKSEGFENFNGYWTWMNGNTGLPNTLATYNPVALLNSMTDKGTVMRSIGNAQFDYKFHFLPELRANLNLGYDVSQGKGDVVTEKWAPNEYTQGGERSKYEQDKRNLLLEFYLNYNKEFSNSRLEAMGGYTYQDWKTTNKSFNTTNYDGDYIVNEPTYPTYVDQNTLISFFGRLNYNLLEKYLLTATIRSDGSSRFSEENRWGLFPSVAFAWRLSEEGFLKDIDKLSNLKLRLGYGITGQQEIGNYEYIARYSLSDLTAQYQLGNNFYQGWRPEGYDSNRKWEQTTTYNIGLDYGFINNRLYGSIDYYYKDTKDLLNTIDLPIGSNFTNRITKNIGNMTNQGVEFNVGIVAIDNKEMHWDLNYNITYNKTRIDQLSLNDDIASGYVGVPVGGISGGTGNTVQMHSVNQAPNTFYLYKQLYDTNGLPIEGAFADLNGDGKINEEDKYFVHKAEPDVFMGFNTSFTYQAWTLSTSLRASIGNYIYNNTFSDLGNYSQVLNPNNFLMNTVKDINNTQFYNRSLMSDYYLENASFLKMDYLTVAYNFGRIANAFDLRLNLSVQNAFTVTKYKGIDPEIAGGIDSNFYPNPRNFSLGLSLNF